jgi:hypothetical protein
LPDVVQIFFTHKRRISQRQSEGEKREREREREEREGEKSERERERPLKYDCFMQARSLLA